MADVKSLVKKPLLQALNWQAAANRCATTFAFHYSIGKEIPKTGDIPAWTCKSIWDMKHEDMMVPITSYYIQTAGGAANYIVSQIFTVLYVPICDAIRAVEAGEMSAFRITNSGSSSSYTSYRLISRNDVQNFPMLAYDHTYLVDNTIRTDCEMPTIPAPQPLVTEIAQKQAEILTSGFTADQRKILEDYYYLSMAKFLNMSGNTAPNKGAYALPLELLKRSMVVLYTTKQSITNACIPFYTFFKTGMGPGSSNNWCVYSGIPNYMQLYFLGPNLPQHITIVKNSYWRSGYNASGFTSTFTDNDGNTTTIGPGVKFPTTGPTTFETHYPHAEIKRTSSEYVRLNYTQKPLTVHTPLEFTGNLTIRNAGKLEHALAYGQLSSKEEILRGIVYEK